MPAPQSRFSITDATYYWLIGGPSYIGDAVDTPSVVAADQLLCELQSVAVEWKSLRQATNCSCAMPFEHHTKKVYLSSRAADIND